jgi:probable FeS assembly SUF system protein SufT
VFEQVTLTRTVPAILIPYGQAVTLAEGTGVMIVQSLGGAYTVETDRGQLARIDAQDADALGKKVETPPPAAPGTAEDKSLEERVWDQLRTCYDPEIPVNIVDLGLVYRCEVTPVGEGAHRVEVDMTLTAPGCGMGGVLKADAERKLLALPGVRHADVRLVIDPPWHQGMMSEAAKLQLGLL